MSVCESQSAFNLAEYLLNVTADDDAPMFHYEGHDVLRRELVSMVAAFSAGLRNAGVAESDRILLLMLDTPALIALFLACIVVGAIPVALNPRMAGDSLRHVLRDSRARFAVIERDSTATYLPILRDSSFLNPRGIIVQDVYLPTSDPQSTNAAGTGFQSLQKWLEQGRTEKLGEFCVKAPRDVAFWQYSSGTTGLPKAVQHTQTGMLDSTHLFARDVLNIHSHDRIFSVPKMFFGYGFGNTFFFPLALGAHALIDSRWPKPEYVIENLRRYRPTVFFGVPAMYSILLDPKLGVTREDLSSVRLWFSAGAPLPVQIFDRWNERFGAPILDGIGATEVGHVFLTNSAKKNAAGSTGYPVPGYQVRLVTENGEEPRQGEQGVLLVKGPSVSPGYWEKPELNRQKFKDGWYRTGDVFVVGKDGDYRCRGREDDLIKVRGRWVVPLEVESMVQRNFSAVKEAVLVGRPDEAGLTEPVLFICTEAGSDRDLLVSDIVSLLEEKLESYKRPRDCIVLNELPRNDNGKLLRARLVEMSKVAS
jgi:benzoate-CoA ligase family protein